MVSPVNFLQRVIAVLFDTSSGYKPMLPESTVGSEKSAWFDRQDKQTIDRTVGDIEEG
jgi:hypothetical protein